MVVMGREVKNIDVYVWYYEIDPKTGEKLYKLDEAKSILIIKYILIDNKYIESASTMLDLQTRINGIDAFFKSHILLDLPDQMIDYIYCKSRSNIFSNSLKKQGLRFFF